MSKRFNFFNHIIIKFFYKHSNRLEHPLIQTMIMLGGLLTTTGILPITQNFQQVMKLERYRKWKDVPENLKTKTQLGNLGLKPKNESIADATIYTRYGEYNLYSEKSAIPKRKVTPSEPEPMDLTVENIALALHTINKSAKRRRDESEKAYEMSSHGLAGLHKKHKDELYALKDRVIKKAIIDGFAKFEGIHTQEFDGDSICEDELIDTKRYLACYSIQNYRFHIIRDYFKEDGTQEIKNLGGWISQATPRGKMKIKDAIATLEKYLEEGMAH